MKDKGVAVVALEVVLPRFPDFLDQLRTGKEVTITKLGEPWAKLTKVEPAPAGSKAGCYRKADFWIAEDFDAPMEEFKEYMG